LNISCQDCGDIPSKYQGGEVRKERNSELANVIVAVEGSSFKNRKDAIAFAVLQKIAGDGPQVKWGNCNTPLYKTVAATGQEHFAIAAFNTSHSDSGLFGFILSAQSKGAGDVRVYSYFIIFS
jgi:ubiquinol-cytochrome c reductase core subunit 2